MTTTSATGTTTSTGTTSTTSSALGSLSGNLQNFLKLLMTQLQNQDPTDPLDTNQFTNQLVQYASVEQQINANTNLTQLISLTQSGQMLQGSSMVGHTVLLDSDQLTLQDHAAMLQFTADTAGEASVVVSTASGTKVMETTVTASKGANIWTWDGKDSSGKQMVDGAYKVTITGHDSKGTATALPFTVVGTVTGISKSGSTLQVQLGGLTADLADVQSVVQ
ncbi:Flagellar basal-body rod modification protein FlgD [Rhodovastum atsumiense]|uniref:Basal-body rod modification protein FlgD n=1 Tax=Rhodovastum atsumiense TaxID=504468 RepID=A0A5M6IVW9_9PROT|nr:flagellar hook capping FlgD N-terminal domain-containing protein [Rhodovastum atsumiense]KAA5612470.1 flagellar biosynthesis protein FlgD [Rhodovastum atsumiense]CAH2600384.1 Flagellar basal-body rod modification protein FlgD [Rhodovastum atsumiense]